ncbi:hypothetical protein [Spongiactinospora sp. TRM90649]|uniref:hypothetical protein n=1 Tax=Spongiactinospora sp. TRM90649 TaxID=3031114 RepID=UPI0023FA4A2F|nr:hypothetical protein [Spongiactinospora sp. TRM90649]MDF5755859.1 hypothetical protein [Spongiactinospora sp. TRM90649]
MSRSYNDKDELVVPMQRDDLGEEKKQAEERSPREGPGPVFRAPDERADLPEDTPGEVRKDVTPEDTPTGPSATLPIPGEEPRYGPSGQRAPDTGTPAPTGEQPRHTATTGLAGDRSPSGGTDEGRAGGDVHVAGTDDGTPAVTGVSGAYGEHGAQGAPDEGPVQRPVELMAEELFGQDAEEIQRRWRDVQTGFVDDPRVAVERADGLVSEVVTAMREALDSRAHRLQEAWKNAEGDDTERLRLALRDYRAVLERLLQFSDRKPR